MKSKKASSSTPSRLNLRDINDLTLHGAFDAEGHLIFLPVFSGLGSKGIKSSEYLRQSQTFWNDGTLQQILRDLGWTLGKPSLYQVRYPALTSSLPLPSPAVLDRATHEGAQDPMWQKRVHSQLERCASLPRWLTFKFVGTKIDDTQEAIKILLAAEEQHPGILTPNFHQILTTIRDLHAGIAEAEAKGQLMVVNTGEITLALILTHRFYFHTVNPSRDGMANWASFFKHIQEKTSMGRDALADPSRRLTFGEWATLVRFLETSSSYSWAPLPDLGGQDLMSFARRLEIAQGQGQVWSGEVTQMHMETLIRFSSREEAFFLARTRAFAACTALGFVWREIIDTALRQNFYKDRELTLAEMSKAWSQRFCAQSALSTLLNFHPSRPIADGGILLVSGDRGSMESAGESSHASTHSVKITPAVLKPHVASVRAASRMKKYPRLTDQVMTLSQALSGSGEAANPYASTFYGDEVEQVMWPQGRLWQAVDLAKTLIAMPELFLCPEVLTHGSLDMSADQWDHIDANEGPLSESLIEGPSWSRVLDWFTGVTPLPESPFKPKKITLYSDPTGGSWPLTVVDHGFTVTEVNLGVQFIPSVGCESPIPLASLVALIQDMRRTSKNRGDPLETLNQALAKFGDNLRFEPRPYFEIDGHRVEESDWFKAVKTKSATYRLPSGHTLDETTYLAKTDQFIIRKRVYAKFHKVGLHEIWRVQGEALAAGEAKLSPEDYLKNLSLRIAPILKDLDNTALDQLGHNLTTNSLPDLAEILRPYQQVGIAWAYMRFRLGLGVCLADEMGLGKTLQAIGLLQTLRSKNKPSLVVMPKTLLINWQRELARYGKDLRVAIHGEKEALKDEGSEPAFDVLLVTYPRLRIDQELFAQIHWNLVILDEAQAIKNTSAQITTAANKINADYRLALTGTPVENRAAELWSIIQWLNAGYLGDQVTFNTYTTMARSSQQKKALLAPLRECLSPIILRRLKSDPQVALGLPEKVHLDLPCDLTLEQTALYEAVLEAVLAEDNSVLKAFARRALYLKAILHLKQICIHPELFYGDQSDDDIAATIDVDGGKAAKKMRQHVLRCLSREKRSLASDDLVARSGKMIALRDLVDTLQIESRGILLFTQYRGAAALLQRALGAGRAEVIPFVHGGLSSEERMSLVDEFNESCHMRPHHGPCPMMILSLKAGGTGLNLIGADRIIHFDRWWNPAVEDQATDRAHRIGQDRSVFIHTLTSQGTIEESIGKIFAEKRSLAEDLLGAAASSDVGELLRDNSGFLNLVDPARIFSSRLTRANSSPSVDPRLPKGVV